MQTIRLTGPLLMAFVLLGACGAGEPDTPPDPPGEDSIDPATGARRTVIQHKDGPVSLLSGPLVPVSLPPGFTLVEGARVTDNAIAARAGGQGVMLAFETDGGMDAVANHYRAEAEAAGFSFVAALETERVHTLAATRVSDGATFSLDIAAGPPTRANLSISTGAAR